MDYQQSLDYLYERLPMFQRMGAAAIKKDLTNTLKLLNAMGNPHRQFRSVHIAGTNGKGTSAHTLAAVLQSAGYKTGLYTSPHLQSFTERIRIDGKEVARDFVADFVTHHRQLIEQVNPSFFEVTVVMAFEYFAREAVDIAIIETGLGGRLDSTNVIDPLVCLITMIGNDHADLLGNTLVEIAGEKAGIIKPGVPVVIGADQPDLLHVFANKAAELNAPLSTVRGFSVREISRDLTSQSFDLLKGGTMLQAGLCTDITASYFLKNVPGIFLVVKELEKKGFEVSEPAFREALGRVKEISGLKGRWQVIGENPLVVADVSHNEPGIALLMEQVSQTLRGKLHLILGMVKDKDIRKVLSLLPVENCTFYFTQSGVPRSLSAVAFREQAVHTGLSGEAYENVNAAIREAKKNAKSEDLILICGSTFVVAEIENL